MNLRRLLSEIRETAMLRIFAILIIAAGGAGAAVHRIAAHHTVHSPTLYRRRAAPPSMRYLKNLRLPAEVLACVNEFPAVERGRNGNAAKNLSPPPTEKQLVSLWRELQKCYGNEDLAKQAVCQNPTIMNPDYTKDPAVISRSKAALVKVMGGDAEALTVMMKNPAVLQCGDGLLDMSASEIELFANLRQQLDRFPKQYLPSTLVLGLALIVLPIVGSQPGADERLAPLVSIAKPLVGLAFALAIEGSRIVIFASAANSKRDARTGKLMDE
jgi:hypothetical protein